MIWKVILIVIALVGIGNVIYGVFYPSEKENKNILTDYTGKANYYEKKNLLTKAEYSFWKLLYVACEEKKLIICPKVRMEDFLSVVKTERKEIMRYRGYIKSRHIDFMICDNALHILAGIELDDNSHKKNDVKKVDDFKDQIFENIKVPLYRVSMSEGRYKEQIEKILSEIVNEL